VVFAGGSSYLGSVRQRSFFVTGTSTGIGRATALHLDRHGHRVFAGVRQQKDADALSREASSSLTPILVDVASDAEVDAAARQVGDALEGGGLDGVVNNAGILSGGPIEFIDLAEVRRIFEVNFYGALRVGKAFGPLLRLARGRVVHVTSAGGRMAVPFVGPYSASKFALEAIADAQRLELAPWGMHVAVVEPGLIGTPILDKSQAGAELLRASLPAEARALYDAGIAAVLRTFAKGAAHASAPEIVAEAIEHALVSARPRTRYVVGMDAKVQLFLRRTLPDRVFDAVLGRALGLPRRA
jgi:NAD(P)-dependent dehydrogenase (short-subunit alcohol dehydrogenase family)